MEETLTAIDGLKAAHETLQLSAQNNELKEIRAAAFDKFMALGGFPDRRAEEYKYSPFKTLIEQNVDFLGGVPTGNSTLEKKWEFEGSRVVLINGQFDAASSAILDDIHLEVKNLPTIPEEHDPLALLNTAFFREEVLITYSGKEKANVAIHHLLDLNGSSVIAQPRISYKVTSGTLNVAENYEINGDGSLFFNSSQIGHVSANAALNITKVQSFSDDHLVAENSNIFQERDSRFYINTYSFSGKLVRNNLYIAQEEEHCESHMLGLYLLDGKSHVDNHTAVDHKHPNSYSNELYKGIVDDKSKAVFNGKIFVREGAQKTNAFQSNNNISLSDSATVNTKPQLEIWADDVKCSHGCTVGQLDEEAIFYLRARGLDLVSAKAMLLVAFAEDTLQNVPFEEVKATLEKMIEERLLS